MIAYFDTSALVKLVLDEGGSQDSLALWNQASSVVTSQLAYPEARAALRAAVSSGRLSGIKQRGAIDELDELWAQLLPTDVDEELAASAGKLADRHGLRGADAIHLGTAIVAAGDDFVVVTWDRKLGESALAEGLPVALYPD
ncbi:MAG: type II toxin-antitoxin system VapC family toxin [Actinomycetota bacterium]|nr:type II toxin-antitoxin system VapC family toxin [Actinomycetota bacterium]